MAGGFYQAYNQDGVKQPVVCTIGDSTFFHSGPSGLINAVYNKAKFLLVILDNEITAMTGMQPTPGTGILADGTPGKSISIMDLVKGCGVHYVKEIDPYDLKAFISSLKEAGEYISQEDGSIAVIIAKHPCILNSAKKVKKTERKVFIEDCNGCQCCIKTFECPALVYNETQKKVSLNDYICINCGICAEVCPSKSIKIT
jgi:indolepyruvate ferredoxin oxidoreductase alpha subunit